jgi:hypothetical protein
LGDRTHHERMLDKIAGKRQGEGDKVPWVGYVVFPHAPGHSVDDGVFIAGWRTWFSVLGEGLDWRRRAMPRMNAEIGLAEMLRKRKVFSLDVLCRVLVPDYRDTMQTTNVFMDENKHILERCQTRSPVSDRQVNGAKLTDAALAYWDQLEEDERSKLEQDSRRLLEYVAGHTG